jgi:hypothetical protein
MAKTMAKPPKENITIGSLVSIDKRFIIGSKLPNTNP